MISAKRLSLKVFLTSAVLIALGFPPAGFAAAHKQKAAPEPPALHPAASIPVQPLGFQPPSMFYLAQRQSSLTLNFIDPSHLLFTFRVNALIQRNPANSQPGDQDQVIRADILDISTGKVLQRTQWTMRDHQRYLWPLGHGKFLIRIGNTLYQTGRSLTLKPFLKPIHSLTLVNVSPGRKYLSIETDIPADPASLVPQIDLQGKLLRQPQHFNLAVYQTAGQRLLFHSQSQQPLDLPIMHNGFLELLSGAHIKGYGKLWVIREIKFHGLADHAHLPARLQSADILTLQSGCHPSLLPLSGNVVLTGCTGDGTDHRMTAVNLQGKKLWQQWWQARYIWHTMAYASNGSRFALGSLMTDMPVIALSQVNISDVVKQLVGVFDTNTGKLVLVRDAGPIVSAGQNFALSANGRRFAILRNQAIEVYNLPPVGKIQPAAPAKK